MNSILLMRRAQYTTRDIPIIKLLCKVALLDARFTLMQEKGYIMDDVIKDIIAEHKESLQNDWQ